MLTLPIIGAKCRETLDEVWHNDSRYLPGEVEKIRKFSTMAGRFGTREPACLLDAVTSLDRNRLRRLISDGITGIADRIMDASPLDIPSRIQVAWDGADNLVLYAEEELLTLNEPKDSGPRQLCQLLIRVAEALAFSPMRLDWLTQMHHVGIYDLELLEDWLPRSLGLLDTPSRVAWAIRATRRHKEPPLLDWYAEAFDDADELERMAADYADWIRERSFLSFLEGPRPSALPENPSLEKRIEAFLGALDNLTDPVAQEAFEVVREVLSVYPAVRDEQAVSSVLEHAWNDHDGERQDLMGTTYIGSCSDFTENVVNSHYYMIQEAGEEAALYFDVQMKDSRRKLEQVLMEANLSLEIWHSMQDYLEICAL